MGLLLLKRLNRINPFNFETKLQPKSEHHPLPIFASHNSYQVDEGRKNC